jgi:hypothetical protein
MVTETGAEGRHAATWLRHVCGEARAALRRGIPLEGLCIYPVADYPGWQDSRHCPCGLIEIDEDWQTRRLRPELAETVRDEAAFLKQASPG